MAIPQILRFRYRLAWLMGLIAVVAVGLAVARDGPVWRDRYAHWRFNKPLHDQLRRRIDLPFPGGVTLGDLAKYVQASTRCPELPKGLPIYLDEVGIEIEAGFPVQRLLYIDEKGAPLGESLRQALEPQGLDWYVRDHILTITDRASAEWLGRGQPTSLHDVFRRPEGR